MRGIHDEQEVSCADAEDVVDIMKACLLNKQLDDTGVVDFRSTGSKSKQVHCTAAHILTCMRMLTRGSRFISHCNVCQACADVMHGQTTDAWLPQ